MRKVLVLMFTTLDGVAEFPEYLGDVDPGWENSPDPMWKPRINSIDTIFLGRRAYEKWAGFWPRKKMEAPPESWTRGYAMFADQVEKVVFSKSLTEATWNNSRIVRGDPREEVARLRAVPGGDLAVGGGPRLAQSFFRLGLVDELLVEVFPTLAGRGKPFFDVEFAPDHDEDVIPLGAPGRIDLRLRESRPMEDGALFLHYERR